MFFTRDELRRDTARIKSSQAGFDPARRLAESVRLADTSKPFDIFLSHSVLDAGEVYALVQKLQAMGFTVYVDWLEDPQLDRRAVSPGTAQILRARMAVSRSLLFAVTQHSGESKWMPWELGYFDGKKGRVAILPVLDAQPSSANAYKGQEYIGLYPYVVRDPDQQHSETLWVHLAANTYVSYRSWMAGGEPLAR